MLDLAQDLKELIDLTASPAEADQVLRQGLDWLERLVEYDLATVFLLEEGQLRVHLARGRLASQAVRDHKVSLKDFPQLRDAMFSRRARANLEEDHAHEGDLFDGVLDLPHGHSCMIVPLCAGERCHGLLALDRSECLSYTPETVALAEAYGSILALAFHYARQREALERLRSQDQERARRLEERYLGDAFGVLQESRSPAMQRLVTQATQVAATSTPVLIQGETGTGKERLARALHAWSPRREAPFVALNAAAIPENLVESELFGHTKGAFTGAIRDRVGAFQAANGGTLLLDEIGDLPLDLQSKLLRVLQEGSFRPVGGERQVRVDVRVIAATHVDLERAVEEGRFRRDLYYRLAVFPLQLPPLRDRLEDLPLLCEVLLGEQAQRTGRRGLSVGEVGLAALRAYAWPGNLRELANALERAAIVAPADELQPADFALPGGAKLAQAPACATLAEVQRRHIEQVLDLCAGQIAGEGGAAEVLGLKPTTLRSRMEKLGVQR